MRGSEVLLPKIRSYPFISAKEGRDDTNTQTINEVGKKEDNRVRKHLLTAGLIVVLLALTAIPAIADDGEGPGPPDKQKVPPRSGRRGKSNICHVLLVKKRIDQPAWDPIWPGSFGHLKYPYVSASEEFEARLIVHHLEPNSLYLVTLYSKDPNTAANLSSVGYYGVDYPKTDSEGGWADIALFQTNDDGNANIVIPADCPVDDPNWGTLSAPSLPDGTYIGVTIAVKYVGTGDEPDWGLVQNGGYEPGGTPDARVYNLYEVEQITFTIGE